MREVAIIGAGTLGGLIAHTLARGNAARVVRLIDEHGKVAEGKALDIAEAAPLEGFATTVLGSTDISTAAGADLIVVADRANGLESSDDEAVMLMRRVRAVAADAIYVCAGGSHRELVERSVRELHMARSRVVGSASHALVGAAAAIVALELDASPLDVALAVLGVPPAHIVVGWSDAALAGHALTRILAEPTRRRLERRIASLWPVGPYALAAAAAAVIDTIDGRSRRLATCFVAADDSQGVRARAAAMPVKLDSTGIVDVVLPELSVAERIALENATLL